MAYLSQTNSSVMSINAITSPCYSNESITGGSTKSRQSSVSSSLTRLDGFEQIPSIDNAKSFYWCDRNATSNESKSTIIQQTSPSFSSFSSSDPESESDVSGSLSRQHSTSSWFPPLFVDEYRHRRAQTTSSIFTDRSDEQFNSFEFFDEKQKNDRLLNFNDNLNYVYSSSGKNTSNKSNRKGDALAVRRARNKLASAKYRAKKQALTHAMQDRIMQLAAQVMSLRDELSQTKRNEIEYKLKYEKILHYCQHNTMADNAAIEPFF